MQRKEWYLPVVVGGSGRLQGSKPHPARGFCFWKGHPPPGPGVAAPLGHAALSWIPGTAWGQHRAIGHLGTLGLGWLRGGGVWRAGAPHGTVRGTRGRKTEDGAREGRFAPCPSAFTLLRGWPEVDQGPKQQFGLPGDSLPSGPQSPICPGGWTGSEAALWRKALADGHLGPPEPRAGGRGCLASFLEETSW